MIFLHWENIVNFGTMRLPAFSIGNVQPHCLSPGIKAKLLEKSYCVLGLILSIWEWGSENSATDFKSFVSLTTAVALEANISAGVRTAKYAILASTYITVTNGIDIPMARGRFLQNDWQVIEQGITLVSLWSVITQFSIIKNILR